MNELDTLVDWAGTLLIASMTWVAGLGAGTPANVADIASIGVGGPVMLGWAQGADDPDIQQVGEETGAEADVEDLDEGAPSTDSGGEEAESLAAEPMGTIDDEDVELLDQGAPPTAGAAPVSTEPVPAASAPVATDDGGSVYVAPVSGQPAGPVLPEGFGTGQVHVSTGRGEFPPGLEECQVGAVTGRAYVGIDCDGEGSDAVGHAPTFEDFPFVLDDTFPFDPDSRLLTEENFPFDENAVGFFNSGSEDDDGNNTVLVSAGRGTRDASIGTTEDESGSSVSLAQRARDRDSDSSQNDDSNNPATESKKRKRDSGSSNSSTNDGEQASGASDNSTKSTKDKSKNDKSKAKGKKRDHAKANGDGTKKKAKGGGKGKGKHSKSSKDRHKNQSGKKD